jgi:hypothetical protein
LIKDFFSNLEKYSVHFSPFSCQFAPERRSKQSIICCSEQECFNKNLYSRKSLFDNDDSFFHHDVRLTDEQRDSCEGNLTFKECGEAHKLMKNGKSPGSDGFTVDFFKYFGKILVLLYFAH